MNYGYYFFGLFLCGIAFLVWLASLVVLLTSGTDGGSPEKTQLKKRLKGFNIALIILTAVWRFIWANALVLIAVIVLAILCAVNAVKLLKMKPQSGQPHVQNYSGGSQQEYVQQPPQEQRQPQNRVCPNCGMQAPEDSYFCVHCGKKI
ncbi:MAG: zinc-ribbon domain-containing protein [Prevotella sp.]|nr:zinc-ribbon domain-containing protein [Prevotella sp.]